jgi:hypothetical protein
MALSFNSQFPGGLWRGTLDRIPTVLGRLAYLAGLRDPVSGSYSHPSLSQAQGPEEADRTLRRAHYQIFSEWLALGLEEQKPDVLRFLADEGPGALRPRDLIPPQARDVEMRLYLTDLETLLEIIAFERRAVPPEK